MYIVSLSLSLFLGMQSSLKDEFLYSDWSIKRYLQFQVDCVLDKKKKQEKRSCFMHIRYRLKYMLCLLNINLFTIETCPFRYSKRNLQFKTFAATRRKKVRSISTSYRSTREFFQRFTS